MTDKAKIGIGLVAGVALLAFPILHALGASEGAVPPDLEMPEEATRCVEDTPFMQANHMHLLADWRNAVVREGEREYTSSTGETYVMSLTGTCLDCHENRDTFCTRCHDFADVAPTCWDCHVEPGVGP
jgi:hypothetical protein